MCISTSQSRRRHSAGICAARGRGYGSRNPPIRNDAEDRQVTPAEPQKQDFIIKVYNVKQTLYTDQTGQFPETSSRGNKYQICLHKIDSNTTWVDPLSRKTENSMIAARMNAISRMRAAGLNPKHQILDNEASAKYKVAIIASGMTYQLVPPQQPLPQHCQKVHPIMEGPFCCRPRRCLQHLPSPPMVPGHPPGQATNPPPPPKQHKSQHFVLRILLRRA